MIKQKIILIALSAALMLVAAKPVSCPEHHGAACWANGKVSSGGAKGYSCSCGDEVWAKDTGGQAAPRGSSQVTCPAHYGSTCWSNGKIHPGGGKGYSCSCGDSIWVK